MSQFSLKTACLCIRNLKTMPPATHVALDTLRTAVFGTRTLIEQFSIGLQTNSALLPTVPSDPPNALALLSDASKVLRAQTTKLSLLVLNKPFTPSEISLILNSLCRECIPAFASATQLCPATKYTTLLHNHIQTTVASILRELLNLLSEIPIDERGIEKTRGRDTLASTGVIWQCCDALVELGAKGLRSYAPIRLKELEGLFNDAIEELEAWQEEETARSGHDRNNAKGQDQDTYGMDSLGLEEQDDPFGMSQPAPENIRHLTTQVLKTLNLVKLLFPPLAKRRLRRFPQIDSRTEFEAFPTEPQTRKLDLLMQSCQMLCDEADEVAGALYQHDEVEVMEHVDAMKVCVRRCLGELRETWDGGEDEFTAWADKWLVRLDEL